MERLCDEERYADLNNDYVDDNHDEEIKRLHLALADGSGYSQINYNYDENNAPTSQLTEELTCEQKLTTSEDSDRFKLPTGLSPPENISLPESQKLHHIIEKTALFVSKHGIQMEIILKTKQSANKNFDFLSFESQLYSYYKYILEAIKSGKYIPNQNMLEMERLCDEERYADLNNDYVDDNHDEEIKRLHLALADGSGYSQINYNYDENNAPTSQLPEELTCEQKLTTSEDSDRFKLPTGLSPPEDILLPESQKLHHIIEKTALFVSKHGIQMEIILKTKQSANKNFDFLSFESQLYSYYKYILEAIKSGKYIPNQNKSSDNSDDSDDDSDGDNYLHPSLLGSSSAKANNSRVFNIPNLLRVQNNDNND
ncbi:unnamed protein product, partial [Medioppia subpectinata]